jgi:hypothetical protein
LDDLEPVNFIIKLFCCLNIYNFWFFSNKLLKIKEKIINSYKAHYLIFPYLLMKNLINLRKINKNFENYSSSYLGINVSDLEIGLKNEYESEMENSGAKFRIENLN